jgi:glycosyltransferase involved in cell wall biosynthesis
MGAAEQDSLMRDRSGLADCAVVIPAFNAARYLRETVASALASKGLTVKIIIVDDGSTDDTTTIAAQLAQEQPNVICIRQTNQGVSQARNAGLAVAAADFVCFLDADDCLRPDALSLLHRRLASDPDAVAAFGAIEYFTEDGAAKDSSSQYRASAQADRLDLPVVLSRNFIDTPGAILFRRAAVLQGGGFDKALRIGEDWEAYVRAALHGPFLRCGETVLRYRFHTSSAMQKRPLAMADFEPAITAAFAAVRRSGRLDAHELQRLEVRKRLNILRLIVLRSNGVSRQFKNILSILRLSWPYASHRDIQILVCKSFLSAAIRCRPNLDALYKSVT